MSDRRLTVEYTTDGRILVSCLVCGDVLWEVENGEEFKAKQLTRAVKRECTCRGLVPAQSMRRSK